MKQFPFSSRSTRNTGIHYLFRSPFVPCLLLFAFFLFLSACYEPKKACLDVNAVNFDATADENCCCNYPRLILNVEQRYDTLSYREDEAYPQPDGHWFRLKKVIFYLSDFHVFRGTEEFIVTDSLDLPVFGPGLTDTLKRFLVNDFALVRRTPLAYPAGAFPESGTFDRVRVRLGLPAEAQAVIPIKAPSGHPLSAQAEKLWIDRDRGFEAMRLNFTRDSASATLADTLSFSRPDFDNFFLTGNGTFTHRTGYDFQVQMLTDYRELFRGVDLANGTPTAWKAQIVANLPNAFILY